MRRILLLLCCLLTGCWSPAPQIWELKWSDDFASLDSSKWSTLMDFPGAEGARHHNWFYASYTLDANSWVQNHHLFLRADQGPVVGDSPHGQWPYSQGFVRSKYTFTYGEVEVRAKFPKGAGVWPCIWLMPEKFHWPPEVDIAEYYGATSHMHFGLCSGDDIKPVWCDNTDPSHDWNAWHTYQLYWDRKCLIWLVDGQAVKETTMNVPQEPMYLILSNSVGAKGSAAGVPDEKTVFPADMEVEKVEIWKLLESR